MPLQEKENASHGQSSPWVPGFTLENELEGGLEESVMARLANPIAEHMALEPKSLSVNDQCKNSKIGSCKNTRREQNRRKAGATKQKKIVPKRLD